MSGYSVRWLGKVIYSSNAGRIRTIWRLLAFTAILVVASIAMRFVRFLLTSRARPDFTSSSAVSEPYFLLYRLTGVIAVACATFFVLRTLEKKTWSDVGLGFSRRVAAEMAHGAALATGIMALGFAVLLATGSAHIVHFRMDAATLRSLLLQFVPVTFLVGLYEELLFRGYPFQVLCEGAGKWVATILVALLFGAAHYANPNATVLAASATALWSILLSLLLLGSKSLWTCIGFHFAGNFVQGCIFNSPVSGTTFTASLLQVRYSGPDWMSGQPGGLEAAVPTLALVCLCAAWLMGGGRFPSAAGSRLLFDRQPVTAADSGRQAVAHV